MSALDRKPEKWPKVERPAVRLAFYPECHHLVLDADLRDEPCERLAVALRLDFTDSNEGKPYPVCARHVAKRAGQMVPLLELMGAKP